MEGAKSGGYCGWGRTILQYEDEHYHPAKSFYRIIRSVAVVCLSMLHSNALISFDNDLCFKRFQQLIIQETELVPPNTEYGFGFVNIRFDHGEEAWLEYPLDFRRLELSY